MTGKNNLLKWTNCQTQSNSFRPFKFNSWCDPNTSCKSTPSGSRAGTNIKHQDLIISISKIRSIGKISFILIYLHSCYWQILFRELRKTFMSGGSGFHLSPEQLQAIIDTGIWWHHKINELRDAERFEDAYALLQEFDVITSRSLEGGH